MFVSCGVRDILRIGGANPGRACNESNRKRGEWLKAQRSITTCLRFAMRMHRPSIIVLSEQYHAPQGLRQAPRVGSNFALILNQELR
jgi:hypothetical protein